jgi:hypothetical protein
MLMAELVRFDLDGIPRNPSRALSTIFKTASQKAGGFFAFRSLSHHEFP